MSSIPSVDSIKPVSQGPRLLLRSRWSNIQFLFDLLPVVLVYGLSFLSNSNEFFKCFSLCLPWTIGCTAQHCPVGFFFAGPAILSVRLFYACRKSNQWRSLDPTPWRLAYTKQHCLSSSPSTLNTQLCCCATRHIRWKKKTMSGCELTSLNWVNCFLMHFFFSSHAVICYSWKANRVSYQRTPEHKQTVDRLLGVSQPLQAQLSNLVQQMYMQKQNTKRQIKPLLCDLLLDIIVVHSPVALLVLEQSD